MARRWRQRGRRVDRRRSIAATGAVHVTMRHMHKRPHRLRPHTAPHHLPVHLQRLDAPEAPTMLRLAEKTNRNLVTSYII